MVVGTSGLTDRQIQIELTYQISIGKLPKPSRDSLGRAQTYYAIFFPREIPTITMSDGSKSCSSFCAYHGSINAANGLNDLFYAVHPDLGKTGCGCGTSPNNIFGSASHELTEMITDPYGSAWFTSQGYEIGDLCESMDFYSTCDGPTYPIQIQYSNAQSGCVNWPLPTCGSSFVGSLRISSNPNKCLDIYWNNQVSGQTLAQWDCTSVTTSQVFTFVPVAGALNGAYYNIKSSKGLCLDVTVASITSGAAVQLYTCVANSPSQNWAIKHLGNNLYQIQPSHAIKQNMCLDNSGGATTNGNKIQISKCASTRTSSAALASQTWSIAMPGVSGNKLK